MRKILKPFIILITLLLPAAIYLFLRLFGVNHFEIPVYYQMAPVNDSIQCTETTFPHYVDMSYVIDSELSSTAQNGMFLVDINASKEEASSKNVTFDRIGELMLEYNVRLIQIVNCVKEDPSSLGKPWVVVCQPEEKILKFARCQLFLLDLQNGFNNSNRVVLIDDKRQIRGYYDLNNFEEIDRLLVEVKILYNQH